MGRHHKPSTTGKRIAQAAIVFTALPAGVALIGAGTASADPLDEIARCESGGNPNAQNPSSTASGTYQFLDSTWQSLGGSGSASDASPAEQRRMAEKLYAQQGSTPWAASQSCWGGKDSGAVVSKNEDTQRNAVPKTEKKVERKAAKPSVEHKAVPKKKVVAKQQETPAPVAPRPTVPAGAKFTPGGDGKYVVKAGDTLSSLAREHHVSVAWLMDRNSKILEMPDWVFEGEKIHLS